MPTVYSCKDCQVDFRLEEGDTIRCPRCHALFPTVAEAESSSGGRSWVMWTIGLPVLLALLIWEDLFPADWTSHRKIVALSLFLAVAALVVAGAVIAVH